MPPTPDRQPRRHARHRVLAGLVGGVAWLLPSNAAAQDASRSNLGLPATAALGVYGGTGWLERHSRGQEAGALLDIGWLRGRQVRLQAELGFLHATIHDSLASEISASEGTFYDVTATATAVWLAGAPEARVVPYALAAVSAHVLSSTIGVLELDQRYNANRFGSQVGAGLRLRLGRAGRRGVFLEARRVIADQVTRSVVRLGVLAFMGDLATGRPARVAGRSTAECGGRRVPTPVSRATCGSAWR